MLGLAELAALNAFVSRPLPQEKGRRDGHLIIRITNPKRDEVSYLDLNYGGIVTDPAACSGSDDEIEINGIVAAFKTVWPCYHLDDNIEVIERPT